MDQFHLAEDAAMVAVNWLKHLETERRMTAKTLEAYARDIRQFGAFMMTHLGEAADANALSHLTPADFRSFMAHRRNDGADSRTLARQMSAVRSFFKFAERDDAFSNAKLTAVRSPRLPHRLPRPLTQDSARAAVAVDILDDGDAWVAKRDRAILLLLYACGLRISEALRLTSDDLLRDPLVITGKGGKTRLVPVLPEARAAVADYVQVCPFPLRAHDPVFRGQKGGLLSPRIVQLHVERLRGALGLNANATPHALRHSFASHMLSSGADLRVIQELLGHASLSTTQAYTEVNRAHLMAQYKKAFG
jgi:integrase/recombinase XerC